MSLKIPQGAGFSTARSIRNLQRKILETTSEVSDLHNVAIDVILTIGTTGSFQAFEPLCMSTVAYNTPRLGVRWDALVTTK